MEKIPPVLKSILIKFIYSLIPDLPALDVFTVNIPDIVYVPDPNTIETDPSSLRL